MSYSIKYKVPAEVSNPVLTVKPDVILKGKNGIQVTYKQQLKVKPNFVHNVKVHLREVNTRCCSIACCFTCIHVHISSIHLIAVIPWGFRQRKILFFFMTIING